MEAVMNMFSRKNQRKDHSLHLNLPSFRKSSEAPSDPRSEVNTEARRKAAAWAWHQRAGGDVASSTKKVVGGTAAVSRKSMVGRPESRFKAESSRETACDMSSKSKSSSGTSLFDASDISSFARQISLFAQKSREESSSKKSSVRQRAFDPSSTAYLSSFRESRQHSSEWEFAIDPRSFSARFAPRQFPHQTVAKLESSTANLPSFRESRQHASEWEFALDPRSFSARFAPRQFPHRKVAKLETQKEYFDSEPITQTDRFAQFSPTDFRNRAVLKEKRSRLKKSLFLIRKIFRKSARGSVNSSDSDTNEQVRSHHHIHHHHHFYHHSPDEGFGILESPKARRHSDSFTSYNEPGAEDQETRQNRRHSEDFALKYRAHIGDGAGAARKAAEIEHYYYLYSPDEQHSSPAIYTEALRPRRYSENFSADKAGGSPHDGMPRMRRHSADIAASHRTDLGAAERSAAVVRVWE